MKKANVFLYMFLCWVVSLSAQQYSYVPTDADKNKATERIIDLHADIVIHQNGDIIITEYFTVYSTGATINRGITRNIPEHRIDKNGNIKTLPVEILDVKHDGDVSEYHTETSYKDGKQNLILYTGSRDVYLEKGIHQYEIIYQTRGHVGFFDDFDELYWNVMGGDCAYTIEHISAKLHPPCNAEAIQWSCYVGKTGSTEQSCNCDSNKKAPFFAATRALQPEEGFTIAVSFPRDLVQRPIPSELFWEQYSNWIFGGITVFIAFVFLFTMWYKKGRDARNPIVIPQFNPPNDWAASTARYLYKKGKPDSKMFTAAILQMAVKGAIKVEYRQTEKKKKRYFLIAVSQQGLTEEEQRIYENLFITKKKGEEADEYHSERELSNSNATEISNASSSLESIVKGRMPAESIYVSNQNLKTISWVMLLLLWFTYMFVVAFLGGDEVASVALTPCVLIIFHQIFRFSIGAQTAFGAKAESELAGLRMYLGTAEKHWLNQLTPPEKTPEHYEKMLPYAIALDVENQWSDKFHDVLKKYSYKPDWYVGDDFSSALVAGVLASTVVSTINYANAQAKISNIRSSYSSSSSSGSSDWSSGSDGGGYSGGGGGGGGVGGW